MLHHFFRAWAVKGFFTRLHDLDRARQLGGSRSTRNSSWIVANPVELAYWLIGAMFMIDVVFATVGYVLTMKPLDAHIRTANPYAAGWTAALICYPPFILMGRRRAARLPSGHRPNWTYWLDDYPLLTALKGAWLVFLTGIYAWATVAFGFRFSNLTHRGILTHGPYAWTKHPAYLSKNLFWWFSLVPFLATTGNTVDVIRNTVVVALISGVYYWRARTEEKHLSADPAYREYAEWMERNGPIPRLIRWLTAREDDPAPVRRSSFRCLGFEVGHGLRLGRNEGRRRQRVADPQAVGTASLRTKRR